MGAHADRANHNHVGTFTNCSPLGDVSMRGVASFNRFTA